mmetsp:Transcript_24711/g.42567  ORF Transcript_24711/g.42567 Transcript_24711/m.42567 type:complete len:637 (-) Transcript_24711:491-2401(-)|eukprot:CAMPEP_0196653304 /NCGR_PEP_ID=MMETSP1086-20130531/2925_1 /TAXON_ID=77921 /ORGANISM="Cyanoptyche  gloeocystis , Strain SAG4.97" /LENGTH=636 /DNA_ID=CAMNT_0041984433 /DNA_START=75 /DNA_END=1985 /DNA_ORIENTATION=-
MKGCVTVIVVLCIALSAESCFNCPDDKCAWCHDETLPLMQSYAKTYNKEYTVDDFALRFSVFKTNIDRITKLNQKCNCKTYAINAFSDRLKSELVGGLAPSDNLDGFRVPESKDPEGETTGEGSPQPSHSSEPHYVACKDAHPQEFVGTLPKHFDWRTIGLITPVHNQFWAGSCYAQGAVAMVENQYSKLHSEPVAFSVQQLIDCDPYECGVAGGWVSSALNYLKDVPLMSEDSYPLCIKQLFNESCKPCVPKGECDKSPQLKALNYSQHCSHAPACKPMRSRGGVKVTGCFEYITNGKPDPAVEEEHVARIMLTYGPIAVYINADVMQLYSGDGVLEPDFEDCKPEVQDHVVTLVGWDVDETGQRYWIVKNSWGEAYAARGYFKVRYGKGICGINRQYFGAYIAPNKAAHAPSYSVATTSDSFKAGDTVSCAWSASAGAETGDFIGLYPMFANPFNDTYILSTLEYLTAGDVTGVVNIDLAHDIPVGYYLCRYVSTNFDGSKKPRFHSQALLVSSAAYHVRVSEQIVPMEGTVSCSWEVAAGAGTSDFIGIYPVQEDGTIKASWLVASDFLPQGAKHGVATLTLPKVEWKFFQGYACYYVTSGFRTNVRQAFSTSFNIKKPDAPKNMLDFPLMFQ